MFERKAKKQLPQQGGRRHVQRSESLAFSYYTSRVSDGSRERPPRNRQETTETERPRKHVVRSLFVQLPFWGLLVVALVCAGKILMLNTNPKIVIVGKSSIASAYLQPTSVYAAAAHRLLASSITDRSKLTVDLNGVSQSLSHEFPELQDVSMSIPLINSRPVVYIQPATPSLVLRTAQGDYALNRSGVALVRLHSLPVGIPLAVDQSGLVPHVGRQILPGSTVSFVQAVAYQLNAAHFTVSTFILPADAPYELDVRLVGKPYVIRFNLQAAALTQSGAAIATVQQLGNSATVPNSYIDVRVPGRAYYK